MFVRTLVVCLVLTVGSVLIGRAARPEPVELPIPFARFPAQIGEWQGVQQPALDERSRETLGVDDYLNVLFSTANQPAVGVFVGFWNSQKQGDTIHSPINCLPGAGWEPLSKRAMLLSASPSSGAHHSTIEVNRFVVQKGLERQMILYWYQSHGRIVASEYWSKLFLVADALRTRRTDAALVRLNTPIVGDAIDGEVEAERLLTNFVQMALPVFMKHLPG